MDRRAFISLVTGSILAAPIVGGTQQTGNVPRIGYLVLAPLTKTPSPERAAFLAGLRDLGWIDGKTIAIEYRSASWNVELLDDLADELVRMKVAIIFAAGATAPLRAARRATSTIPIVMTGSPDPIAAPKLGLTLKPVKVRKADDLARAFAVLEKERPDALTMLGSCRMRWISPRASVAPPLTSTRSSRGQSRANYRSNSPPSSN